MSHDKPEDRPEDIFKGATVGPDGTIFLSPEDTAIHEQVLWECDRIDERITALLNEEPDLFGKKPKPPHN